MTSQFIAIVTIGVAITGFIIYIIAGPWDDNDGDYLP